MKTRSIFVAVVGASLLTITTALPATALTESDFGDIVSFGENGYAPAIVSGPADGTSLVVYADEEIFGQFVDTELGMIGAPFQLSNADTYSSNPPTAEWNPERQEWLVVWEENEEVVAGRIVEHGVGAVGSQLTISDSHDGSTFGDMELAYAAYAADQDVYLVAFKATVTVGEGSDCQAAFGVFVNADGTVPTTEATILSTPDAEVCAEQVDNGANVDYSPATSRWLVGWAYSNGANAATTGTVLVENVAGVVTIDVGPVIVGSNSRRVHPSIEHDSTRDRFLTSWHADTQVFGALVDNAGAQIGTRFAVNSVDARGDQRSARMIYDAAADLFLTVNHNTGDDEADPIVQPFVGYWELAGATGASAAAPQVLSDPLVQSERPDITIAGDCVLVVWQWEIYDELTDSSTSGLQGRSSCFTPELAATGATDTTALIGLGALVALALGGALMIARRPRIARV